MLIGLTYLFLKALWALRVSIVELHASSPRNEPMDFLQRNRLERLEEVIKKHCILVGYCSVCTLIIWSCALYTFDATTWVCWELTVDCICVWMMTKNAKSFWNCCKTKGFCCCCYWKSRMYVDRMRLLAN